MKVIKETTLHPEDNDGVDLYPKTSIKQVENLSDTLTGINQTEQNLVLNKLDKPATPTTESAVVLGTDGRASTKPLSEIGGGKLYIHNITITVGSIVIKGSFLSTRGTNYTVTDDFYAYFLPGSTIIINNVTYGIIYYGNQPSNGYRDYEHFNITTYEKSGGPISSVPTFSQYFVIEL